jgi:hypothetical protein
LRGADASPAAIGSRRSLQSRPACGSVGRSYRSQTPRNGLTAHDKRAEPRLPATARRPSQAAGYDKRSDKQIDRARVLEVRIHLPPAVSQQRTVPAAGQRAPFGTVSIKRACAVVVSARSGKASPNAGAGRGGDRRRFAGLHQEAPHQAGLGSGKRFCDRSPSSLPWRRRCSPNWIWSGSQARRVDLQALRRSADRRFAIGPRKRDCDA